MRNLILALVGSIILTSCGSGSGADKLVTIKTEMGDMTVLLYDETPLHKSNFIELAESGKYDSTIFHRVMKDFMIQGGDIFRESGTQESEAERIPAEINDQLYHIKGALAAARQADQVNPEKKSSSCQFYIVDGMSWDQMSINLQALDTRLKSLIADTINYPELYPEFDQFRQNGGVGYVDWLISKKEFVEEALDIDLTIVPRTGNNESYQAAGGGYHPLDGGYTVFGRVVEGLEVIDKIAAVRTVNAGPGNENLPVDPIYLSMKVTSMAKSEITKKYGYTYPESEK